MSDDRRVVLDSSDLHGSLSDPVLDVMNFLNEVTTRHPHAISFGPGRPYEGDFGVEHIVGHLATYVRHLRDDCGASTDEITTLLYQYGPTSGLINDLVARTIHNDEGISADPAAIVVTVGCQEAMFITLRALFGRPDDVLLVPSPCYIGITGAARLLDIETVLVREDEDGLDLEELRGATRSLRRAGKRARAVYVVPDFANPTGTSMTMPARRRLLALAEAEDLLVIEDNPYGLFTRAPARATLKSLDVRRRVVYLGSFAKTCFPGARVGYVVADQPVTTPDGRCTLLAAELSKVKSMVSVNTSAVSQAVIGGMLLANDCRLREANKAATDFYSENLALLLASLEEALPRPLREGAGISWNAPQGGFFVTVTLPFPADNGLLERSALDYGVIWTPMRYFFRDGNGTNQMRLSISDLTPSDVVEGARRLGALLTAALP